MGQALGKRSTAVLAEKWRGFSCPKDQQYELTRNVPSLYHCEQRVAARFSSCWTLHFTADH